MKDCTINKNWLKAQEKVKETYKKIREQNEQKYLQNPKYCPSCNNILKYDNNIKNRRFCNQSCSSSYNNKGTNRVSNKTPFINQPPRYCKKCGDVLTRRQKEFCSVNCVKKFGLSNKTKEKLKTIKIKWCKENRNKHNWSLYHNRETKPEKEFRHIIKHFTQITFTQYYTPPENDRFFEIDFADIKNKIGFEINGNQHYEKDGNLTSYCEERQLYLENKGWMIINIHYLLCFKKDYIIKLITNIYNGYSVEYNEKKTNEIFKWRDERKKQRELEKQNKEQKNKEQKEKLIKIRRELMKSIDLTKYGCISKIAKICNVSDTQVKNWLRKYYVDLEYYTIVSSPHKKNKYINRQEYLNFLKSKSFKENESKIEEILTANIDFSKFGWCKNVATLLNIKQSKVNKWMKKFIPEFYEERCFKRKK